MRASSSSSSFFSHFCSAALRAKPLGKSSDVVRTNSGEGLVRRLGPFDLILLGIGASIGAGIFVVTGTVARDAGPGVTISFLLAGAACVLNALCYAELASRFPAVVGGAYLYTYTAFNELTAFLVFTQMMLDYHIGAASIARSLASYVVNVTIVLVVIIVGAFEVDDSNWSPFAPNGFKSMLTGATVAFFAYVGFDAVANSAEESKRPQRDLPIGIIGSLLVCVVLYIGVCLVITGMVPYNLLGEDAPLAEAFKSKGLNSVSVLISIGAIAGLTTTLLVGLYVQSRLYLGLGRDGLLPAIFAKVHPSRHTPIHSQIWVGIVACILAGLLNVTVLSHILSVGSLAGYSIVAACVMTLRWEDKIDTHVSTISMSKRIEGITCITVIACCGLAAGIFYRYSVSTLANIFLILPIAIAIVAAAVLQFRQVYKHPPGFSCPWVPIVPAVCIFFNIFLFAQLHYEAWVRFAVLSIFAVCVYAFYGQYNAKLVCDDTLYYHLAPEAEGQ
ncbi:cationic amino acid transporter 9, chloroplastic-like isoform X2 [Cynara cardunculus var. scolymus]|uniref:cationic amino acid transporter 9, chloroplastic-like isoform X2 n=1 Tax=Cynara cardunculus var. scolymus TaxID=59895 RepID=UPI000D624A48|nr:cationic amino acid transporter 9, chloroplastic-like isoform X2 [Cynara cardunculus var. scolymus]